MVLKPYVGDAHLNFLRQLFYFTKIFGPNYTVSVWNYVIDA